MISAPRPGLISRIEIPDHIFQIFISSLFIQQTRNPCIPACFMHRRPSPFNMAVTGDVIRELWRHQKLKNRISFFFFQKREKKSNFSKKGPLKRPSCLLTKTKAGIDTRGGALAWEIAFPPFFLPLFLGFRNLYFFVKLSGTFIIYRFHIYLWC